MDKTRLLLAFEYGVVIAETARMNNVEITPEIIKKAEAVIMGEFQSKSVTRLSVDMIPNVLSVFEIDLNE